jgi:hypothetical protein
LNAGETFHAQAPGSTRPHLYVAVTSADANGDFVIANITSQAESKDQSCILHVGDHPFISKESVVNYAEARIANERAVSAAARRGVIRYDAAITPSALAKVQAGALASTHTELGVKAAIRAALGQ